MNVICAVVGPGSWLQGYDPAHRWWLSTIWAALPLVVLLTAMGVLRIKAHLAALMALGTALVVVTTLFHMPVKLAGLAAVYGAGYGLFPIFWIIFPVIFLYGLTVRAGRFQLLQECLVNVTEDSRLQLLLIAFAIGAFFEGAAGFGTPVAVCSTILLGLGFRPLQAAGLALLANTAPVAFGSLGIPVTALHGVTGLDTLLLTRVIAAMLVPFCLMIPFWVIWTFAGFKGMLEVWPAALVAGGVFGGVQYFVARVHGPWLVDLAASICCIAALVGFLRVWKPKRILNAKCEDVTAEARAGTAGQGRTVLRAGLPWAILVVCVTVWGTPQFGHWLDGFSAVRWAVGGLDKVVFRMPPAVPQPAAEGAVYGFNWLSATGTGILVAAVIAGLAMRLGVKDFGAALWSTVKTTRFTVVTIAALMALGFVSRFCGLDATLGLAFARTGVLYPFFGTLIGWLGTASTGSDTSSNVLFGSLQKLTAQQLGISPYVMASANSGGGVMGKMVAPQSVVIASTATGIYGKEGSILRYVFLHSLAMACLMGVVVAVVVYVPWVNRLVLR
jgi:lactate permease